jgi:hypothetical protein
MKEKSLLSALRRPAQLDFDQTVGHDLRCIEGGDPLAENLRGGVATPARYLTQSGSKDFITQVFIHRLDDDAAEAEE